MTLTTQRSAQSMLEAAEAVLFILYPSRYQKIGKGRQAERNEDREPTTSHVNSFIFLEDGYLL